MEKIDIEKVGNWYDLNHEKNLNQRYLNLDQIKPFLKGLDKLFEIKKIGEISVKFKVMINILHT